MPFKVLTKEVGLYNDIIIQIVFVDAATWFDIRPCSISPHCRTEAPTLLLLFLDLLQRLNSPAMSVTNESFVPLLAKLDDCIKFMKEHVGLLGMFVHAYVCICM